MHTPKRKATTYVATAPDGTVHRKRTFKEIKKPVMGFFEHNGIWYAACVTSKHDAHGSYENRKAVPA